MSLRGKSYSHAEPNGMRVLGYGRVSTATQEREGMGLPAQEQRIREACEQRGWQLLEVVREGASGKDLHREALQAVLSRLAGGEAEGLVVAKMDRLSRSIVDFAQLTEWFRDARLVLVVLDLDVDTSTPTGEAVANVLATFSQMERRLIGQRTKEALGVLRAEGRPVNQGSVADRAELADRIRAWRSEEHLTYRAICARLNADGVPTVRGGVLWRPSAVQAVLGAVRRPARRKLAVLPEVRR